MGFKQSSAFSSLASNDLFGDVITGCLAGFGIWTKPSPKAKMINPVLTPTPAAANNVFPLRVIRVKDANPQLAGRMVISGRMADVCAELDRLAA
jgi:hypothetical protein